MDTCKKRLLGAHMSIAGGIDKSIDRGLSIGCTAIQIFTGYNNRWQSRKLGVEETEAFLLKKSRVGVVFVHANYLANPASPDPVIGEKSLLSLIGEVRRAASLSLPYLIVHPGAHMGAGEKEGLKTVTRRLNELLESTENSAVQVLLEITAGQGTVLGSTFEQLADITAGIDDQQRVGVCFDTCHAFAAGYDLRSKDAYEKTFEAFDRIIGLSLLKVFHLNDSRYGLGSGKDRHEHIGQGMLGLEPFRFLLSDERFCTVPMVIETPARDDADRLEDDRKNLEVLRMLIE